MKGRIYKEDKSWVVKYDNPTFNIDGIRVKTIEIHPEDVEDLEIIVKHAGYNDIKGDEFMFEIKSEWIDDKLIDYGKLTWSDLNGESIDTWNDLYREYIKEASEDYIYFLEWLKKYYNVPTKK